MRPFVLCILMCGGWRAAEAATADARVAETMAMATQRCTQLAELVSCDAALSMRPNDPELLLSEADVLVQLKRPGEAIGVYRNALRVGAHAEVVQQKITAALMLRQGLAKTCLAQAGDVGERACESAWLPGAPDEVALFKRRGLLLREERPTAALDAYLAAARLAPRDRDVARAILALSSSLDAQGLPILVARGAALMTLHRPQEAVVPLRQAVKLSPDSLDARNLLRQAEQSGSAPPVNPAHPDNGSDAIAAAPSADAAPRWDPSKGYSNDSPITRSQ